MGGKATETHGDRGRGGDRPYRLAWLPGEQQRWADIPPARTGTDEQWQREIERHLQIPHRYHVVAALAEAPEHLARPHLAKLHAVQHNWRVPTTGEMTLDGYQVNLDCNKRLLARYGAEVLEFTVVAALAQPWVAAPMWMPIEGSDLTALMVKSLDGAHSLGPLAREWVCRHSYAASLDVIPAAVGKPVTPRRQAEFVLRLLDRCGHRKAIRAAAATFPEEVSTTIEQVLDGDPLLWLPTRIPKQPAWLRQDRLPRIRLRDSAQVLPQSAVAHVLTMLMMCGPDKDYAGVRLVTETTDPASIAEFAWALFTQWQSARFPAKTNPWPLRASGLLGDDLTASRVRNLAEKEQSSNRASTALDMLELLGTRDAHTQLQILAEKSPRVGGLAARKIETTAARLGITVAEFADGAVPDLGMSARGEWTLDYGTRQFVVSLDEQLKLVVRERDGTRRARLPKPARSDDPVLAANAYAAHGVLQKTVKSAIADQSDRLEAAMVGQRRWSASSLRSLFIAHPFMRQLVTRLVWIAFDTNGIPTTTFRIDDDRAFVDVSDEPVVLADDTVVGIAHPVQLGTTLTDWARVFSDYQLLQPFEQLDRPHFAPGAPRLETGLVAYVGEVVSTGRILGLRSFGWVKLHGDGGLDTQLMRTLPGGEKVWLDVDPGIEARNPMAEPKQRITSASLGQTDLAALDPIVASELLRELEYLR
ncbi:DUF4132 domain-containing protein [Nocardia tengchongensis]|uniref:DUF4132 domain-containing protein n=2 Tax=Nocardia tengchongensis TaxID=2055889 RepID=UPI00368B86F7